MRILIADDDATSRLMLKAMASKLGHECLDRQGRVERVGAAVVGGGRRPAHRLADAGHRRDRAVPAGAP